MIYPNWAPIAEVNWELLNGVEGHIRVTGGLAVLVTSDHRLIVLAEHPDLVKKESQ